MADASQNGARRIAALMSVQDRRRGIEARSVRPVKTGAVTTTTLILPMRRHSRRASGKFRAFICCDPDICLPRAQALDVI